MTQGDKAPPQFTKGQRLKASDLNGLSEAIASVMRRMQGQGVFQPQRLQAVLMADLLAAVDTLTDPSTTVAEILRRNTAGDLERSGQFVTVVNRFENISIDQGVYVKLEWLDGEWQPYAADCPGSASMSVGSYASASASLSGATPPGESI